jgi:hypothetical protein
MRVAPDAGAAPLIRSGLWPIDPAGARPDVVRSGAAGVSGDEVIFGDGDRGGHLVDDVFPPCRHAAPLYDG